MLQLRKLSPRSFDWVLCVVMVLLIAMGFAAVYSVDLSHGSGLVLFRKQILSAGVGLVLFIIASLTQYTWYRTYAKHVYGFSLLLLIAVLIFGTTVNGTRGWFTFAGFSLQPVEIGKLGVIMVLAYVIYHFGRRFERPLFFIGTALLTGLVCGLVLLQPDLGSVIIIGTIWFGIMLLVGARRLYLLLCVAAVAAVAVAGWLWFLQPYQKERILNFIEPGRDPLVSGYNRTQATIAIGAGKFFGQGLGFGSQSQLRFLPAAQTDFIFSVIAEELGFVGAAALLVFYGVLMWRLVIIIQKSPDDFSAATVSGIAIVFFVQFFVNVGANLGILPITGVTLPLVSYGGSSLVISMTLLGIAQSMVEKKY